MNTIYIYAAGSGSREIFRIIRSINLQQPTWEIMGFVDPYTDKIGSHLEGITVIAKADKHELEEVYGICGVMDQSLRQQITKNEILPSGLKLATIIHPDVEIPPDLDIGPGSVIYSGVNLSFGVKIGSGAFILFKSLLGHDLVMGDFVTVLPSSIINGGCRIEDLCLIGAGSILAPRIKVGKGSIVGIGSTVLNDVPPGKTLVSLPRQIASDI